MALTTYDLKQVFDCAVELAQATAAFQPEEHLDVPVEPAEPPAEFASGAEPDRPDAASYSDRITRWYLALDAIVEAGNRLKRSLGATGALDATDRLLKKVPPAWEAFQDRFRNAGHPTPVRRALLKLANAAVDLSGYALYRVQDPVLRERGTRLLAQGLGQLWEGFSTTEKEASRGLLPQSNAALGWPPDPAAEPSPYAGPDEIAPDDRNRIMDSALGFVAVPSGYLEAQQGALGAGWPAGWARPKAGRETPPELEKRIREVAERVRRQEAETRERARQQEEHRRLADHAELALERAAAYHARPDASVEEKIREWADKWVEAARAIAAAPGLLTTYRERVGRLVQGHGDPVRTAALRLFQLASEEASFDIFLAAVVDIAASPQWGPIQECVFRVYREIWAGKAAAPAAVAPKPGTAPSRPVGAELEQPSTTALGGAPPPQLPGDLPRPGALPIVANNSLRLCGANWEVSYGAERGTYPMKDFRALGTLAKLLPRPNHPYPLVDLVDPDARQLLERPEAQDIVQSSESLARLRERYEELERDKASTEDPLVLEELDEELEDILAELKKALGPGGRKRKLGRTLADRAWDTLTKSLRRLWRRLQNTGMPELAAHLEKTVHMDRPHITYNPSGNTSSWDVKQ
jgi:hypothetical protein